MSNYNASKTNINKNKENKVKITNLKSAPTASSLSCWLLQIPSSQLSDKAKILYSRLAQWGNESGIVYRSSSQLAQEIGSSIRSVERTIKELRDVGLIGTYQIKDGGVNHYEFYDHEWMHIELNKNLTYKSYPQPTADMAAYPADMAEVVRGYGGLKYKKHKLNNKKDFSVKSVDNFFKAKPKSKQREEFENCKGIGISEVAKAKAILGLNNQNQYY